MRTQPIPTAPKYGEIISVKAVRYGALAGTDNIITVKVNGTTVVGATITMSTTADAAGDTDEVELSTPTTTALVNEGDTISFNSGGQADDATTPCMFVATVRNRRRHG